MIDTIHREADLTPEYSGSKRDTELTPKRRAELAINAILQRLEAETGRSVVTVKLRHADVTYLYGKGQEDLAGIEIHLHPGPENRVWEVKP